MLETYEWIVGATNDVCAAHLNEEYAELARSLAAALSRKRPSPLASGSPAGWACAILYTLGRVNFLFDRTQTPSMTAAELASAFGISKTSAASKSKKIIDLLNIREMDPAWTLPSMIGDNPLAWFIQVDGLIVDARQLPREIQEVACRKGLIPYVPLEEEKAVSVAARPPVARTKR